MAEVTRYKPPYPRVALAKDTSCQGNLIEEGPEQSEVHWDNGNKDISVINRWIVKLSPTGRLPSQPNMQGVPIRTPEGKAVREALIKSLKSPPDDLSDRLKAHSLPELKAFAISNGVWDAKYATMPNPGLVRMNVVNRLRAKIRKGHIVVWK